MILKNDICSGLNLNSLLTGDEASQEYQSVLSHVDNCPDCQQRLEQLAADSSIWHEATRVLSSENEFDLRGSDVGKWHHSRHPIVWSESMASQLLSPASHPELIGRIGRYDVDRLIGSGGMGLVFKAHDTELNRPVAVKLLAPYLSGIGSARKRFAREARAAAAIMDEHVVAIYNVESSEDPREAPFLVMKYIAGGSLQQRIDQHGHLEVCEILRIALHTAKGLTAAHAQGLIHRDVKPSNILLDEGVERALLTDFGLARTEDDACLTRSGFHPGTPHYMSPEQVRGESIDARSDLFGLGCVIYAMCTGHPPFRAETSFAVLRRITDDEARPIREINSSIPVWLEQIVMKLLSKKREDRFESAETVSELLAGCLAHLQHPTHKQLPAVAAKLSPKRRRLAPWARYLATAMGAVAIALAGILIVLELNKGTLRIECDTDDIPIRVVQGENTVKALTLTRSGKSIRVAAGQYTVEFDGEITDVEMTGDVVSLSRGGTQVVQIKKSNDKGERTQEPKALNASDGLDSSPIFYPPEFAPSLSPFGTVITADLSQKELATLKAEHAKIRKAYIAACDQATDETELNRVYEEMDPREIMPSKYLAFEKKNRGTKGGFEALKIVSNLATSGGGSNASKGRAEAIGRLIDHYIYFEGFEDVVDGLSGGVFTPRTEELLEALASKSPNLQTRAAALIQLIRYDKLFLDAETQVPVARKQFEEFLASAPPESPVTVEYERILAKLEATDFGELRKEVNKKLDRLSQYCDTKVRFFGTAENAAKRLSHAINKVVIGQKAPELIATDMDGQPFQLSQLQGKIVVLIFSQDKDFAENYAPVRQLVARYRQSPVRVVGVMGNNTSEELLVARERGEINWTAIPETVNGPLFQSWGMEGFPYAFIIGADGTLNAPAHMPNYGAGGYDVKEIRDELDKLLQEVYARENSKNR